MEQGIQGTQVARQGGEQAQGEEEVTYLGDDTDYSSPLSIGDHLTLLLAGALAVVMLMCGCKPKVVYVDRPVEVKIMVPVPAPEPPKIERPRLKPLPPHPTPEQVAEASLRGMLMMMGYASALEEVLNSYRTPVKK
jgi:hypothetical protein